MAYYLSATLMQTMADGTPFFWGRMNGQVRISKTLSDYAHTRYVRHSLPGARFICRDARGKAQPTGPKTRSCEINTSGCLLAWEAPYRLGNLSETGSGHAASIIDNVRR